jgi:hypothetical protein
MKWEKEKQNRERNDHDLRKESKMDLLGGDSTICCDDDGGGSELLAGLASNVEGITQLGYDIKPVVESKDCLLGLWDSRLTRVETGGYNPPRALRLASL